MVCGWGNPFRVARMRVLVRRSCDPRLLMENHFVVGSRGPSSTAICEHDLRR